MDCSLPGSSVHGIFQARVLEWGAIHTCTLRFIAALFTVSKTRKQPKCPSTDNWFNKMWYVCVLCVYTCKYICEYWKRKWSHSVVSNSLPSHGPLPARLLCPWDYLGKSTGVGWHFLLQGIFPTQESNQGLLHCRWILYQLSYQGSPVIRCHL